MRNGMNQQERIAKCDQPPVNELLWRGPLYKYMKRDHAEGLIKNGIVKVGTLYDFRREYEYGEWVGDRLEGYEFRHDFRRYYGSESVENVVLRNVGFQLPPDQPSITIRYSSPDYYIYCVAAEPDRDAMEEGGYDACVQITDPYGFFGMITNEIHKRIPILGPSFQGHPVEYRKKEQLFDSNERVMTEALWRTKCDEARYRKQTEVRMRWTPLDRAGGRLAPLELLDPFPVPMIGSKCKILS